MVQYQPQRRFGLLQYHFSQQETVPVPVVSSSSILPNKVASQIYLNKHVIPDTPDLVQSWTASHNFDLTTCLPIVTKPYPISSQASSTPSYPMQEEQVESMIGDMESDQVAPLAVHSKKTLLLRTVAIVTILALPIVLYLIWRPMAPASSAPLITQQNLNQTTPKVSSGNGSITANTTASSSGDIQVYILGAVMHPGVYTLSADARVYQLLQVAGGPLPKADLVALNLAAKLSDGQEIYVTYIGESPPTINSSVLGTPSSSSSTNDTSTQSLVNINTATADEMRQQLSVSSKTAQDIVSYRQQHGPFTSVDQLLQVVSTSIYNKIKDKVTV